MFYPYLKHKNFLSPNELNFYNKLVPLAQEKGLVVFPKVRLADLVRVPKGYKYFNLFFSRIKAKQIDFVLCDQQTFEIKCLVELDDKTHELPERKSRDKFVNKVVKKSGHEFIRCSSPEFVCRHL